jgi:hypothetical protein
MRRPKLKCIETGKSTDLDLCRDSDKWQFEAAMNQLVGQALPGHVAVPLESCDYLRTFQTDPDCRRAEVVGLPADDAPARTGRYLTFELML